MIMGIAMVAMLAFGGTFAYFTATANGTTVGLQTGTLVLRTKAAEITSMSENIEGTKIVPGHYIYGSKNGESVTYKNITLVEEGSTVDHYIFVKFTVTAVGSNYKTGHESDGEVRVITGEGPDAYERAVRITVDVKAGATDNEWHELSDGVYYMKVTGSEKLATDKTFSFVAWFNEKVQSDNEQTNDTTSVEKNNTNITSIMGVTINVNFAATSIQAEGYDNATEAFAGAFKTVTENSANRT